MPDARRRPDRSPNSFLPEDQRRTPCGAPDLRTEVRPLQEYRAHPRRRNQTDTAGSRSASSMLQAPGTSCVRSPQSAPALQLCSVAPPTAHRQHCAALRSGTSGSVPTGCRPPSRSGAGFHPTVSAQEPSIRDVPSTRRAKAGHGPEVRPSLRFSETRPIYAPDTRHACAGIRRFFPGAAM